MLINPHPPAACFSSQTYFSSLEIQFVFFYFPRVPDTVMLSSICLNIGNMMSVLMHVLTIGCVICESVSNDFFQPTMGHIFLLLRIPDGVFNWVSGT